jgi:hypothetical protein
MYIGVKRLITVEASAAWRAECEAEALKRPPVRGGRFNQ